MANSISYRNSPVVEVVVSALLKPSDSCSEAHFGAFWTELREQFPDVRAVRPVRNRTISRGSIWVPGPLRVALSDDPEFRLQMISEDDQWVCQMQRDRLILNWRKRSEEYPRYDKLRAKALVLLAKWEDFSKRFELGKSETTGWEVTYVNRISESDIGGGISFIGSMIPGLLADTSKLPKHQDFMGIQGKWVWNAEEVSVTVDLAPHQDSGGDAYILSITSQGKSDGNIETGWDAGHSASVQCFDSLISDEAKVTWERQL